MLRFGHWSDAEGGVERVAWVSFRSTEVLFFGSGVFAGMSMCCEGPDKSS